MLLSYYFYTYYARYLIDQLIVKANFITSRLHYFTNFTGEVSSNTERKNIFQNFICIYYYNIIYMYINILIYILVNIYLY